ncbi:DMT family transporter [Labrys monachus]|uniref:Drug/metabolite transporter (DMT)-like permease n=1 Tax=Labrys monachus TaxID=217067 RepID=A0ABU0FD24_9HYPH|nr:DMT family transporter [Labrys monachus]MDQ0392510.1 drug/metabolite transporter (DMT)-like permease [Labrys monachus]
MSVIADSPSHRSDHRIGVFFVAASALAWSASGIYVRLLSIDAWTTVSLRAAIGAAYLIVGLLVTHRRNALAVTLSIGWLGIAVAACASLSMLAFVGALYHTSIADVSVIYATTPFVAAGLGWLVLKESVPLRTFAAALAALIGVAIMVGGSFGSGRLLGDALALAMALTFAIVAIIARARPGLEMLPTNVLCCLFTALAGLPFAAPATATAQDWLVLAVFAFTSIPLAFFMFLAGARRIPAAESGLITTLDVVLSPLWVYLIFAENPGRAALVGGCVVFVAVVWHILGGLRRT